MCGIAGIFDDQVYPRAEELHPMLQIMTHRGPDAEGSMVCGPIAFGMRRLSIIDLTSGDQPIFSSDKSISVICNGEIYNYVELKRTLIKKGYNFYTKSDTEVLVHLYAEYGTKMLSYLNGMFAFAIWDETKQSLLIARDRLGIKPLYYSSINNRFLFASELKSILTHPGLKQIFDLNSIADYLRLGYIPREETPYQSVKKLLPGHYLEININGIRNIKWWDINEIYLLENELSSNHFNQKLAETFDHSIQLRMRSDVPIASFLSGGLDSSLISVTARNFSDIQFQTFNVKFKNAIFDESRYADLVSKHSFTDHKQIVVSAEDALDVLPLLLWHMDEPILDTAIIPSYFVSKLAAQTVKVCLSGIGGDELFGGYSRYIDKEVGSYRKFLRKFPWLLSAMLPIIGHFNPRMRSRLLPYTGEKNFWNIYLNHIQILDPITVKRTGLGCIGNTDDIISDLWNAYPGNDTIGRRQYIDIHTYLPDQILALTDRMSMAVSLEVRVPFLDHELLKLTAHIHDVKKQTQNGEFKILLKQVFGDRVPQEILGRRKWGFAAPVTNWISHPKIKDILGELPKHLNEVFDKRCIKKIVSKDDDPRYHNIMWSMLVLATWIKVRAEVNPPEQNLVDIFK